MLRGIAVHYNSYVHHQIVSEDEVTPLLAARHRLETRGRVIGNYGPDPTLETAEDSSTNHANGEKEEVEEEGRPGLDENGNPTSSTAPGPFPIMDPQLRPLSIYRWGVEDRFMETESL